MRLKSLELQGYKSFATKTVFQFDEGVTAVVGPNGSGKSNVSDAVRWVLGEQSYSILRGKKTEDMIFSGSDGRAQLGMAYATLVFDNSDGGLPVDFTEVTITRRAYRDGQNEYRLNGSRVRLRDITELLGASGLGRRTYTHVGQGLVDAALALRSEERRTLFEEAAGIVVHNAKRTDALNKLDATQANLLRLHDIVSEIEPRMRYLKRQAERADTYGTISSHLQNLLNSWYGYRWREGQQRLREARLVVDQGRQSLDSQEQQVESITSQILELRNRQMRLREHLGEWHRDSSQLHDTAEAVQRELAVREERARLLSSQRDELLSEVELVQVSHKTTEGRVNRAQTELEQVERELTVARQRVEALQVQRDSHQVERQSLIEQQAKAERQSRKLADRIAGHQARLAQLQEREQQLETEATEAIQAIAAHKQKHVSVSSEVSEMERGLAALTAEIDEAAAVINERQATIIQLDKETQEVVSIISEQRRQLEALRARQELLAKMQRDMAGYYQGVRSVLTAVDKGSLKGIVGTVTQLLKVSPNLENAVETVLGAHLQDIVVERWSDAEAAIAYLKKTHGGRATLLPLDTIRPPSPMVAPGTDKVLGIASDLISCDDRIEPVARLLLGRTLVVEDLPSARRALDAGQRRFQVVTRAGDLVRSGGSVSGGSVNQNKSGGGFLTRQREGRELPALISEQEVGIRDLDGQLEGLRRRKAELQSAIDGQSQRQAELQLLGQSREQERQTLLREAERIEQADKWHQELLNRSKSELHNLTQRCEVLQREIEEFETERDQAHVQAQELAKQVAARTEESLLTELSQARTALAVVQGRFDSQKAILDSQKSNLSDLVGRIDIKRRRCEELAEEREQLLDTLTDQRQRSAQLNEQIADLAARIEPAEGELLALEQRQGQLEGKESRQRQSLHSLETEVGRLDLELSRRQDEMDNLRRQIEDDLGLVEVGLSEDQTGQPYLPLHPLISQLPVVEELPDDIEQDIRRLRAQIGRLGSVNIDAPQEFEEMTERHQFLSQQMADLEKAATDLRQVIDELDHLMEQDFSKTFEAVAREFKTFFKQLFGGGDAQLILTDPDNLTETGVDIVARPPGKRAQNLNMLSGGERSLTAAALIFALLKTSPTPFCILDEVDAMLDEANVGRFREVLQSLAEAIQFIVITHNRRTIEVADTIYGISMGDDSVSRMISLKLEEVEEMTGNEVS